MQTTNLFTEVVIVVAALAFNLCLVRTGKDWKAADLRRKSWDDLHKLWYANPLVFELCCIPIISLSVMKS